MPFSLKKMIRNHTHIAITLIVTLVLISIGYLTAQQITNTEPDYDAGIAAYQRGHYSVALYDFESRAKRGDIAAQFCLAFMYKHGYGLNKPNSEEALGWYKKAAEQGYSPAQNNLGVLYVRRAEAAADKSALIENLKISERWLKMAAEQGYAPAQFNLYIVLPDKHVDWLIKAAARGYPPAQNNLGFLYNFGSDDYGVAKNFKKAVEWYTKAANQGYAAAQRNLGICYEKGTGVKQNRVEAFKWYEKSAKQGYTWGQYSLGLCYHFGLGVAKNPKEAFTWFSKAAEDDHMPAQNNLASSYVNGLGVPEGLEMADRLEMANRWYLRAAQQGESVAQSNIGMEFVSGQDKMKGRSGISQDDEEAYFWYSLALQNEAHLKETDDKDRVARITKAHEKVRKALKTEQIAEIDVRIEKWKPKHLYSSGTGFYVDKHYILTNAHVVIDRHTGEPWNEFRIPYRRVELIDYDLDVDLALLYDKRENIKMATFRRERVKSGEKVSVFGYPQSNLLSYEGNIAPGNVSGRLYQVDHPQFANRFQYTAPTQRGNSGGPVFDSAGNVIGVYTDQIVDYERVFAKKSSIGGNWIPQTINLAQNVNFAIKFNVVRDFLLNNFIFLRPVDELTADDPLDDKALPEKPVIDIPLTNLRTKAETFTVPVLCFKNKEEQPLEVEEVGIEELRQ